MAISPEYIAELSRRTDITELVRSYVELKRAGRLERGLCPFHNEKSPSFYVYPETNSFYCFGCGAAGDAISFIKRIQNLNYPEAVRFLAARAGMALPDEDDDLAKLRGRILAINRDTARFYVEMLNREEGKEARAYLRARALGDGTIRRFGLGYAPDSFDALRDHLRAKGYSDAELLQAGVCKKGRNDSLYDMFRSRILFPIIDLRGNVIAFGGRGFGEDRGPKYLNSADTLVFKKSRNLFALNMAKKSASRRFLLAEGYMDVISLHQAGFSTAVATLGTALTADQAKLLSDYADEVVICYDADEAGQKATARAIDIFKATNLKVRVLDLPDAKDPDEFIKNNGAERFEQILEGSGNTIEYNLQKVKKQYDLTRPDGRAGYIQAALEVLAAGAKPAEQDIYAGRVAEETDVAKSALLAQLAGVTQQRKKRLAKEREKRLRDEARAPKVSLPPTAGNKALGVAFAEQQLLAAILKNPVDYLPLAAGRVTPEQFISPDMAEAYRVALGHLEQKEALDLALLSGQLPDTTLALLGKALAMNYDVGFSPGDVELFLSRIESGNAGPEQAAQMSDEALRAHFDKLRASKENK